MNYQQLKKYAEDCQMSADEMAYKLISQEQLFGNISVVQSICDFNLSWLYQVSPEVVIHSETLVFIANNVKRFTRKITIKEMMRFDSIIYHLDIKDFDEFREILSG